MPPLLAYLPVPPGNGVSIGPLRIHVYGLLIAAGIVVAVWLTERRWAARGGDPAAIGTVAWWAVPAGLIGARLYHVITDYELYTHHPWRAFAIWDGGLGIWGAVAGGAVGALYAAHRQGLDARALCDAVAPSLPLAQAIGRWGNYFNQELYGRPTTLPWAVKIDAAHRAELTGPAAAYAHHSTFQPTFLYECIWDLIVVGIVLLVERRVGRRIRKGYLFAVYVASYTFGRFFTEYMRIDFAHRILGLRINDWVSVLVFAGATLILVLTGRPRSPDDERVGDPVRAAVRPRSKGVAEPRVDHDAQPSPDVGAGPQAAVASETPPAAGGTDRKDVQ